MINKIYLIKKVSPKGGDLEGATEIKVAILDLYDGIANEGMRGFQDILNRYKAKNTILISVTRYLMCVKNATFLIIRILIFTYTVVARSPLDTQGTEWEKKYFNLIDKLEDHNLSNNPQKKHAFFRLSFLSAHVPQIQAGGYQYKTFAIIWGITRSSNTG